MFLNEEYFRRHSIIAPLVKASERSNLIFRSAKKRWKTPWVIFEITKIQEVNYRPPYFVFKFLEPLYDGCEKPKFYKKISEKRVYFDQYELEIINHIELFQGLNPISDLAEAKIAAWEIFLYCSDRRSSQIPIRLREDLWKSIDNELPIEIRMLAQENIIKKLHRRSNLIQKWIDISTYCNPLSYANWLAKIIHDARADSSYRIDFSDIRNIA